ncbi:cell adhesion molecule DSCAML1-like [Anthonomus grandis grandis]|uniref:cell adhesion molecule DSCAML1-like n=1 Tax=Anthonomus grandis grandis TaxID=2921223 RepID=UPI0021663EE2|nr:cell adhesion molecule DSCAML1-like [Anthonomus grandis grandis]XP_050310462.1 cell adhesion molecule DSCAML1-like [Anthonomus grandis grandis]XP_050310464.1 cell adhesion molecule DSCAML1-like [Anthonomus grandis grandis]XP_050310465.1 cell adhesion molecule DSCAML1-like [Anthonomus grandis grandis]XP_050310466.1 cell adhesion molecule DSCAML1-like [Anthonomus grandis grandis]XP_050310467.1 cell adhesion molecule DSCAML1-like [Anthonomus grandis grandis]XP_050310468.1 cell adhesion molecu
MTGFWKTSFRCLWFFGCLVSCCHGQDIFDTDGFSNDSPFTIEPKVERIRVKVGTPITLKCAQNHQLANHTIWEYKECSLSYKDIACNLKDLMTTNPTDKFSWKKRSNRHRLEIHSTNKNHSGLYRCVEKGFTKKSVIIEVVGSESYEGPPPSVQSLITSNLTNQLNMEFTIQCNVSSVIPPTIIWFKKCYGSKCDIEYDELCYCHLNVTTTSNNIGNTYISKMNIFKARDVDSGLYACLAVTEYGKDYKNVTIIVPDSGTKKSANLLFSLLFLVPLALVVLPLVLVWLCYFRRKKKKVPVVVVAERQQQKLLLNGARHDRHIY